MGEMLDDLKRYLKETPQDVIDNDLKKLDEYNTGSDINLDIFDNKGCLECVCYKTENNSKEKYCSKGHNIECQKWWQENGHLKLENVSPMHCFEKGKISEMLDNMINKCQEIIDKI